MIVQKSLFVTFEGPNGIGKTTVIKDVAQKLSVLGCSLLCTKEPTGSSLGDFLRKAEELYGREVLACIAAADRYFHIEKEIAPALATGRIVLSDRYVESSLVLQRLDGCSLEFIWSINSQILVPDLSIIFFADPVIIGQRLVTKRTKLSRFERDETRKQEMFFYHEAAEFIAQKGFHVLLLENEKQSVGDTSEYIVVEVQRLLKKKEEAS
ncbi:MAG: dTMP kinase [Candidatus Pacebacteria bacterium]|nr:dTMP kinase [Candidatus Paceibacterota bacterium]